MAAVPIYATVAWLVCQNHSESSLEPAQIRMLFVALAAVYFLLVVIEPMITGPTMRRFGRYEKNTMILRLGIYESGAVFGLFLTFVSYDLKYVLGFGMAAIILILLKVPVAPLD